MYQSPADAAPGAPPPSDDSLGAQLRWGTNRLAHRLSAREAAGDAALLLAAATAVPRAMVLAFAERGLAAPARERYEEWIGRRALGEPVAYILGRREFWSMELRVTHEVLVPRPETELLVERALRLCAAPLSRVLDLGTGSGAIALALARERPGWQVTATDLSDAALEVARANAAALGLGQVEFLRGSWFEPLAARRFELVVSNPPYVAADDPVLGDSALRFEPRLALTPGGDGLGALRTIVSGAPEHLEARAWLLLEHGGAQAGALAGMLVARGFRHVRSRRDLAGHQRVTEAQWPGS